MDIRGGNKLSEYYALNTVIDSILQIRSLKLNGHMIDESYDIAQKALINSLQIKKTDRYISPQFGIYIYRQVFQFKLNLMLRMF